MTSNPDLRQAPLPGLRDRDALLVADRWIPATGPQKLPVVNPATEQTVASVVEASGQDVDAAVRAARAAFDRGPWPGWSPERRAQAIEAIADGIQARVEEIAALVTIEVGMPGRAAAGSVANAIACLRYYADQARMFPFRADRNRADGGVTRIMREPAGVVGAIAPWNGPLGVLALKLGPALAAGCTVVFKPAPETPLATYVVADIIADLVAGGSLPPGVVNMYPGGREAGEALVAHPGVDKVTFTGSTAAGRRIMATAAERIGRVTLELGGKSAAIIADDADVPAALRSLIPMACGNSGQMCFALTRVLVSRQRHDEVVGRLADGLSALVVGDPLDPATTTGPLAMARQRDRVEQYVGFALEDGAQVVTGGGRPAGLDVGYYFEPTLLDDVRNSARVAQEEIFGPVVSVLTYEDIDDAVAIANDSVYGLSGSVYTGDPDRGFDIARRVRTGTITVNGSIFDTTMPFGGYKQSGLGREGGPEGMEPFLETKSVHMPR